MLDSKDAGNAKFSKDTINGTINDKNSKDSIDRKQKLLIHLGMGGHTSQILRTVKSLSQGYESGQGYKYEYVIGHDDQTSEKKIEYLGQVYKMRNPRLMKDRSILKVALNMIPATVDAFKILWKSKPKAIISAGPSSAIPLFWLAKMMGIKTIFIESWVRVHHGSISGRLVYPVCDKFIVQWESMKKTYPKAVFAGRLS